VHQHNFRRIAPAVILLAAALMASGQQATSADFDLMAARGQLSAAASFDDPTPSYAV
jgi:hypothetical protein